MVNLILALLITFSATVSLDYVSYICRKAPKSARFSNDVWRVAFITNATIVYYVINGFKFTL